MITVALIASLLMRPLPLVEAVWDAAVFQGMDPVLAIAVVEYESRFRPRLVVWCDDGTTDWGLFQVNSRYHVQYRESIDKHIAYGASFLAEMVRLEKGNIMRALARYNTGDARSETGRQYAERVLAVYVRIEEAVE